MNYMEQVAHMLGVELEEEFNIYSNNQTYKLTSYGMFVYDEYNQIWEKDYITLETILCGSEFIIKKPILDEVEKEYLSNIIKPFRKRVEFIVKRSVQQYEYIEIAYRELNTFIGNAVFPLFAENTMYKNMKINKEYTLDELGL